MERHKTAWRPCRYTRMNADYIRVSTAGMKEAAPHDVVELKTGN
ncbi:MAG: hypothetical protein ACLQAH_18875 [Limisphaerales bacterium]